jgi:hypothetical protein
LDRNKTDIAEHVERWRSHIDRWLRQLERVLRDRGSVSRPQVAPRKTGLQTSQTQALDGHDRARKQLEEHSRQLTRKIEALLTKIEDVGFISVAEALEPRFRRLRSAVFPGEPQRARHRNTAADELRSMVPSLRPPSARPRRRK